MNAVHRMFQYKHPVSSSQSSVYTKCSNAHILFLPSNHLFTPYVPIHTSCFFQPIICLHQMFQYTHPVSSRQSTVYTKCSNTHILFLPGNPMFTPNVPIHILFLLANHRFTPYALIRTSCFFHPIICLHLIFTYSHPVSSRKSTVFTECFNVHFLFLSANPLITPNV